MPYCLKCGNEVDETIAFCPRCGTALKDLPPSQVVPVCAKEEKAKKQENQEHGFLRFLIMGLILITVGFFAILGLTGTFLAFGQDIVLMLVIIGVIIITGFVYTFIPLRKYFRQLFSRPKKSA